MGSLIPPKPIKSKNRLEAIKVAGIPKKTSICEITKRKHTSEDLGIYIFFYMQILFSVFDTDFPFESPTVYFHRWFSLTPKPLTTMGDKSDAAMAELSWPPTTRPGMEPRDADWTPHTRKRPLAALLVQWTLRMPIWSQMTSVTKLSQLPLYRHHHQSCLIVTWYTCLDLLGGHNTLLLHRAFQQIPPTMIPNLEPMPFPCLEELNQPDPLVPVTIPSSRPFTNGIRPSSPFRR